MVAFFVALLAGGGIISTAPAITETLFALGLGDRVAGVTTYCNYPEAAKRKPRIGTFLQPNVEAVLALTPSLVIVQKNPIGLGPRLQSLGLRVLEVDQPDVEGVFAMIRQIGEAAGVPDRARRLESDLRSELTFLKEQTVKLSRPRVMFFVGRTPGAIEGLVAVGGNSYLDQLIAVAGGVNALADAKAAYPKVMLEEVLARNPDVIIDMGDASHADAVTEQHKKSVVALWNKYPVLTAVRNRRVYAVASGIFVVPGPRMAEAAREFARMLHPGKF
jgi:iron complex transport system substrate-binding protein